MSDAGLRAACLGLSALGLLVAGYLTYVHYAELEPICAGGSGGCAVVQASEQSKLAGVPVALLGLGAYLAIVAATLIPGGAARALGALTALVGFGFSAYLTVESVTVIDATCQWCLASLAVITLLAATTVARLLRA